MIGTTTMEDHKAKVTGSLAQTVAVVNTAVYRLSYRYQCTTSLTVNGVVTALNSSTETWGE